MRTTVREHRPPKMIPMANGPTAGAAQRDGHDEIGRDDVDADGAPWLVVVVRAWTHEGRRVVRMTRSATGRRSLVCYETSSVAAGQRLTRWLDGLSARPVDPPGQDAPGDVPATSRRRSGIGAPPTVSADQMTQAAEPEPSGREQEGRQPEAQQRRSEES